MQRLTSTKKLKLLPRLCSMKKIEKSETAAVKWIEHPGKASRSTLIGSMHHTNVEDCKEWCATTANCAGFGWKPKQKNCWFAKTSSDPTEDLLNDKAEVNFYETVEVIETASVKWIEHPGKASRSTLIGSMHQIN